MDFEYSPHRSAGGTLHMLSPTHSQYSIDAFPSIKQIRRSLSRSPSKPSRYHLVSRSPKKSPPRSGLSRALSANTGADSSLKNKLLLRRNAPVRANARKETPHTLRRALSDASSQANTVAMELTQQPTPGDQENAYLTSPTSRHLEVPRDTRFEVDDEPIKFDFLKGRNSLSLAMSGTPAKSSPLKRSDGVMNLDQVNLGSPRAKRRSLHSASLGVDFDVFEQAFEGANNGFSDDEPTPVSPVRQRSPQRNKPFSLRRTTLQQRVVGAPRARPFSDLSESPSGHSKARARMSLDGSLPLRGLEPLIHLPPPEQKAISRSAPKPHPLSKALSPSSSASSLGEDTPRLSPKKPQFSRPYPGFSKSLPIGALRPKPHTDSSGSSDSFETPEAYKMAKPLPQAFMSTGLISKRNRNVDLPQSSFGSSMNMPDTPSKKTMLPHLGGGTPAPAANFGKFSRPLHEFGSPTTPWSPHPVQASPESFGKGVNIFGLGCSSGKSNRRSSFLSITDEDLSKSPSVHMDVQASGDEMPPTPTKAASSGSTTIRPTSKGKGNSLRSSLFGRRSSIAPDTFNPPTSEDQQPANDCKYISSTTPASESKTSGASTPSLTITPCGSPSSPSFEQAMSLRQSHRKSCPSPLTLRCREFPSFSSSSTSSAGDAEAKQLLAVTPSSRSSFTDTNLPPQTPQESFTPPDPSGLSISGEHRGPVLFGMSGLQSSNSFPPATPTGPRDSGMNFGASIGPGAFGASVSGFFANDVDTALTSRFESVQAIGLGEFSQVYRVSKPVVGSPAARHGVTRKLGNVWAVKKSKKPYLGVKDRENKMREVHVLQALRGNEHILDLCDSWESKNHLYIQTEFCENGNLKDFLTQTGFKGRLDDFRIWKILLEMSQGVKCIHDAGFIHLDLKPANVLIDWEGVLKIADFGMATTWPAPRHIEGEGDREYIGPEVLSGKFDKPADIFSLGMIMLEIAGNIVLPDNGLHWQRLRSGDLSDVPSLTWSSENSLPRYESGEPMIDDNEETIRFDDDMDMGNQPTGDTHRRRELAQPPNFMIDPNDSEALDKVVEWMICPSPEQRPVINELLNCGGVQWVEQRRRAGATIYEGNWGPADDVLNAGHDIDMVDI
ncbi:kinase-like protein [Aureobasidium pullulans]|uniref:Kinase-like protein n=1 Tax=Aureobasidium pullulans TaxID=5580 RepID=A0A4S9UN79_AURPU|nr:kinase-like protein [Aureobasidium pullulans]THZ39445.1 kinase-like protein [Aureobasidium pullulans]THZ60855.1 kinase-like protein [Aureobasidium pullulans]THZ91126.1 kinase-like protein [Aureobasidium pullulans]